MSDERAELDPESVCLPCKAGFHNECTLSFTMMLEDEDECCCKGAFSIELYKELDAGLEKILADEQTAVKADRVKDPHEVTDWESTGRKRAKEIAVIFDGMVCQWAFLKFAGGGAVPIVGCNGNQLWPQSEDKKLRGDRHHGPDKNVLNNAPLVNLWVLCTDCHNRWHTLNDKLYPLGPDGKSLRPSPTLQYLPAVPYWQHDATTRATEEEFEESEAWWALPKGQRPEYPFMPAIPPIMPREKEDDDGSDPARE